MTCSTGMTKPVRKPIDQDACGVMKEDEGEIRGSLMNASKWWRNSRANLLRFALQAGLYRASPRDQVNDEQLSRPSGDDPFREES